MNKKLSEERSLQIKQYLNRFNSSEFCVKKSISNIVMYLRMNMISEKDFLTNEKGELEGIKKVSLINNVLTYIHQEDKKTAVQNTYIHNNVSKHGILYAEHYVIVPPQAHAFQHLPDGTRTLERTVRSSPERSVVAFRIRTPDSTLPLGPSGARVQSTMCKAQGSQGSQGERMQGTYDLNANVIYGNTENDHIVRQILKS